MSNLAEIDKVSVSFCKGVKKNAKYAQNCKYSFIICREGSAAMFLVFKGVNDINVCQLMDVYYDSMFAGNEQMTNLEILQKEQDFYQDLFAFFREPSPVYFVLSENGRYISALRSTEYKDGVIIAGLETKKGKRRRGYAKKLLQYAVSYLHEKGIHKIYSHVDSKNQASLSVHYVNGFYKISDSATFLDGTASDRFITLLQDKE